MPKPHVLILRAPGTNCDVETAHAFERAGGAAERVFVQRLMEEPGLLERFQILCVPGGFSYGDDLAAGRILAEKMRRRLFEPLQDFIAADKLALGVCNGFQALIKSGLLFPDDEAKGPAATLTWNTNGRFECRWVNLEVDGDRCVFLRGMRSLQLPIAHAEGRFLARDKAALDWLDVEGLLVLRYAASGNVAEETLEDGETLAFPLNPNGSPRNVAGACDVTGRVLGLMPHPERYLEATHHPRWTRGEAHDPGDGLRVFRNAVEYFA